MDGDNLFERVKECLCACSGDLDLTPDVGTLLNLPHRELCDSIAVRTTSPIRAVAALTKGNNVTLRQAAYTIAGSQVVCEMWLRGRVYVA
jgi:hypothetical protein